MIQPSTSNQVENARKNTVRQPTIQHHNKDLNVQKKEAPVANKELNHNEGNEHRRKSLAYVVEDDDAGEVNHNAQQIYSGSEPNSTKHLVGDSEVVLETLASQQTHVV